ncbi:MAG: Holliday junction branch migration protein RuvA [Oscillospiraceae bacterium]|nr:Holliday junction branch migration protein RuvA [Oscillospiraceae bacterium]
MFHYLKGSVAEIGQNSLVLDVGGIGFFVSTSLKTISNVTQGQQAKLYISEAIGESNFDLYGFSDLQEKRFFELLTSVSGVGPKAAISLLSSMNTDTLVVAIINDDAKALTSAPGIGKKIAQRIILELRDKLGAEIPSFAAASSGSAPAPAAAMPGSAVTDAMSALAVLGYSTAEVSPIIRNGDWTGMDAEQIIRAVLKNMV